MVYKAQAEFLMDAVCSDTSRELDELLECLKKIKVITASLCAAIVVIYLLRQDFEFVCELCMLSPMLSYNVTCAVVEHCYQANTCVLCVCIVWCMLSGRCLVLICPTESCIKRYVRMC